MSENTIRALFEEDAADYFRDAVHHNDRINGSLGSMIFIAAQKASYGRKITLDALTRAVRETEDRFSSSRVVRVLS